MHRELNVKEIVDLTVPMKSLETPVFPGSVRPLRTTFSTIQEDGFLSYVWTFNEHTGTHVDAPAHVDAEGQTIDRISVNSYFYRGIVLDFSGRTKNDTIRRNDLVGELGNSQNEIGPGWIVLLYTGYTDKVGTEEWLNYPGLDEGASEYLMEEGVSAIGVDAVSPDRDPFPPHHILLAKGVTIYEGLTNLNWLLGKSFVFLGLPLRLVGGSGSPVRAIAMILDGDF